MALTREQAVICQNALIRSTGYKAPSTEYIIDLVGEGSLVEAGMNEFDDFDTEERENLQELVATKLVGQSWPMYSDGQDSMDQFTKKLHTALEENGWERQSI